jgi:hypothetical protein
VPQLTGLIPYFQLFDPQVGLASDQDCVRLRVTKEIPSRFGCIQLRIAAFIVGCDPLNWRESVSSVDSRAAFKVRSVKMTKLLRSGVEVDSSSNPECLSFGLSHKQLRVMFS